MQINHLGLTAFYQCALKQSMTEAAQSLGVTQSALSQRIAALEDDLETTLFIREGKSLKLSAMGLELLDYCHHQSSLENQLLSKIKSSSDELAGTIRIGAYSSVLRSIIFPKLAPFLRQNPKVLAEINSYETSDLHEVLKSNKADFIVTDFHSAKKGLCEVVIGHEEFVVVESVKYKSGANIYIDHDVKDKTTEDFFSHQSQPMKTYQRIFMGDVYGIIDAVEQGLGRAVMSRHLIAENKKVKIVSGYKKMQRPIVVSYLERPYYSKVFIAALSQLQVR